MKNYLHIFLLFSFTTLIACRKESGNSIPVEGKIKLQVTAVHHSWGVSDIDIYLKKNASDWPGHPDSTLYNAVGKTDKGGNVEFRGLLPGFYFIYAEGYDSIFRDSVYGKAQVNLDASTVVNNEGYVTLYVNER